MQNSELHIARETNGQIVNNTDSVVVLIECDTTGLASPELQMGDSHLGKYLPSFVLLDGSGVSELHAEACTYYVTT
jgi:hypothetical protein